MRRPIAVLAAGALAVAIAVGVLLARSDPELVEIEVFQRPDSFCAAVQQKSFEQAVRDVADADRATSLGRQIQRISASLVRRTVELEDTPPALDRPILDLARDLEKAATTAEIDALLPQASSIDRTAATACAWG